MLGEKREYAYGLEEPGERGEAAKPSGDFLAMVSSAVCCLFTSLGFYQSAGGEVIKGYQTPYGILVLLTGAACFIFSMTVLWAKFLNNDFRLARSPGWAYSLSASVIVIASIMAIVLGYHGYQSAFSPVLTFGAGVFVGFAGLMKF